jgi:hypothetical protein
MIFHELLSVRNTKSDRQNRFPTRELCFIGLFTVLHLELCGNNRLAVPSSLRSARDEVTVSIRLLMRPHHARPNEIANIGTARCRPQHGLTSPERLLIGRVRYVGEEFFVCLLRVQSVGGAWSLELRQGRVCRVPGPGRGRWIVGGQKGTDQ